MGDDRDKVRSSKWQWKVFRMMDNSCILGEHWEASVGETVKDHGSIRPDCGVDGEYMDKIRPILEMSDLEDDLVAVDKVIGEKGE